MKTILALATVATALMSSPASAQADFTGATINYSYYFPTTGDLYTSTNYVVGPGVEVLNVANDPAITLDISGNTIMVDYYRSANWSNFLFNGWVISDQINGLNDITGVTINPSSTWLAFNQSNIAFTADSITVNWAALNFSSGDRLLLDVTFAAAGVPEPSTWAMMLLGFGCVGFAMRRRRNTTSFARSA